MKPTKSVAPLVLGINGGIFGILGGSCLALCGAAGGDFVKKTLSLGGWIILVAGILGLVAGCCAKKQAWGSLVELIAGVLTVVGMVLAAFTLWSIVAAVLLIIGGAVGMAKKAE